jgi:hypothetical protein
MYADSLRGMSPGILKPVGHEPTNRRGGAGLKDGGQLEQESGSRVCTLTRSLRTDPSSSPIDFEKSRKQPNRVVLYCKCFSNLSLLRETKQERETAELFGRAERWSLVTCHPSRRTLHAHIYTHTHPFPVSEEDAINTIYDLCEDHHPDVRRSPHAILSDPKKT